MMVAALGLGVVWCLDEVNVVPWLGLGRHGFGQLVFKARGALGYTARIKA